MKLKTLDLFGNIIASPNHPALFFRDLGENSSTRQRYLDGIYCDFVNLILLMDTQNRKAAGYISYWTQIVTYKDFDKMTYQVNCVFLRNEYRNRRLSNLFIRELTVDFVTIVRQHNRKLFLCDASQIISDEGNIFAWRLKRSLTEAKLLLCDPA